MSQLHIIWVRKLNNCSNVDISVRYIYEIELT